MKEANNNGEGAAVFTRLLISLLTLMGLFLALAILACPGIVVNVHPIRPELYTVSILFCVCAGVCALAVSVELAGRLIRRWRR